MFFEIVVSATAGYPSRINMVQWKRSWMPGPGELGRLGEEALDLSIDDLPIGLDFLIFLPHVSGPVFPPLLSLAIHFPHPTL